MRTYNQFKQRLDEMEYQAPPKPAPKAPIEQKAKQPETRKAPGLAHQAASKLQSAVKSPAYQKFKSDSKKTANNAGKGLMALGAGVGVAMSPLAKRKDKKKYSLGEDRLDEMEYQAPPQPVPKAPIERKAQQPETRKAPSVDHASGTVRPASGTVHGADNPTDERSRNKQTPKKTRHVLSALTPALKRLKKGKGSVETQKKGPGVKAPKPVQSRTATPSKSSFKF